MKVIITGGAGFIRSAWCALMADASVQVVNLDRLTYAVNWESLA